MTRTDATRILVDAALEYASACDAQDKAARTLARCEDDQRADDRHSAACDRLSEAEHGLRRAALLVAGWTGERAAEYEQM